MTDKAQPSVNLEEMLKSLMEGLGDPRVADVLSGPMMSELVTHVASGLPAAFQKTAAEFGDFDGVPAQIFESGDVAQATISWVHDEAGQFVEPLMVAIAGLVGEFVVSARPRIISSMKAAGDGPEEDRSDRIVSASALVNTATAIIERIDREEDVDKAREVMVEAIEKLEEAREILMLRILDDAIMFGSKPDSGAAVPDDVPELSPNGRRVDVENLLFDSWSREVDGHLRLAGKVGPEIDGTAVAAENQHDHGSEQE